MLDVPQKIFVSCRQISLEQVLDHVVAPLISFGERLMVNLGVFIEFLNIGVYRGGVDIYTLQVLPRAGVCGPVLYDGLLEY